MKQEFSSTIDWIKKRLGDKVASVQISNRLSSSPCVLVSGKFGWSANMERLVFLYRTYFIIYFWYFFLSKMKVTLLCLNQICCCRLMKAQTMGDPASMEFMKSRRVFEINPDHSIIRNLDVRIFFCHV